MDEREGAKASWRPSETWVYDLRWPESCQGDWVPPSQPEHLPVLLIHGGGWRSLDRHSVACLADFFVQLGHGVFNVDYRLIGEAPWPACGEDCHRAAELLLEKTQAEQILVVGASAGGHLALMTGLALTSRRCRAILSLAGITRLYRSDEGSGQLMKEQALREFFGGDHEPEMWLEASPINQVTHSSPRIWLVHSRQDQVVLPHHSAWMADACHRQGIEVQERWFQGRDSGHGFWQPGSASVAERKPVEALQDAMHDFSMSTTM